MTAPTGQQLPVVIVSGMHSDARREVVEGFLRSVARCVALTHDLTAAASRGVVRSVARTASTYLAHTTIPLVNDCACCTLREDLLPTLGGLAADGATPLVVLELWDSVEPQATVEAIVEHIEGVTVTGVIAAVDPGLVLPYLATGEDLAAVGLAVAPTDQRTVADTWARQLEYASVVALAASDEADDEDRALLGQLHPTAPQATAGSQELVELATAGFDLEAANAAQHPACARLPQEAEEAGVSTLVWRRHRPFHPQRLYDALEDLGCAAARSRGRFWLADRPGALLSWDAAGGALCIEDSGPWLASLPEAAWTMFPPFRRAAATLDWHPVHGDRCQHLVFVSPGLDRDGLAALLDSCLLTDDEYAGGQETWAALPPAFDALLDPAR